MPKEVEYIQSDDDIEDVYSFDYDTPDKRHHAYRIFKDKKIIHFYPLYDFCVKKITLEGFKSIPKEFSPIGYIIGGLLYFLGRELESYDVEKLTISKIQVSSFKENNDKYQIVISYDGLKWLKSMINSTRYDFQHEMNQVVGDFFHEEFPDKFPAYEHPSRVRATRVIKNIDKTIIKHFKKNDIEKVLEFVQALLSSRYASDFHANNLLSQAKLKLDEVALHNAISSYNYLMEKKASEGKWGKFLQDYLFLIESKYIKLIPELNVMLAGARKVDFGMVDSNGYLDIFEIKKPNTKLLASSLDRGNYYWSTDTIKAITQAEKYLFNASRKAAILAEDINREKGVKVKVINPRAVVIIGHSSQFVNENMDQDFRILRRSLKNIEIILYDEILDGLTNQYNKIHN